MSPNPSRSAWRTWGDRLGPWLVFALLMTGYAWLHLPFFPNAQGTVGADYSWVLPTLLDNNYWFQLNPISNPPWFTPAFCGGIPVWADPQSFYYSVPQMLAVISTPLTAVTGTLLLFAGLGYGGFYALMRLVYRSPWPLACMAGALFMINGFFINRMVMGHLTFHAFMLVPWIALLLRLPQTTPLSRWGQLLCCSGAGVLLAYWVHSGFAVMIVPAALAVIALILPSVGRQGRAMGLIKTGAVALGVAFALSASRLEAVAALMQSFPRSQYPIAGMDKLWTTLQTLLYGLFYTPADLEPWLMARMRELRFVPATQDLEFGVTLVPLLFLAAALLPARWLHAAADTPAQPPSTPSTEPPASPLVRRLSWLLLGGLALLPLLLSTHFSWSNTLLKSIPIVGSLSSLHRFFVIDMVLVILLPLLWFQYRAPSARTCGMVTLLGLLGIGWGMVVSSQSLQHASQHPVYGAHYRVAPMEQAAREQPTAGAPIAGIASFLDRQSGAEVAPLHRNDLFLQGGSSKNCYNALFGYQLEMLPMRSLHLGPITDLHPEDGYNMKNPVCYVYPQENGCRPGDHFSAQQGASLDLFTNRRPYEFEVSAAQHGARWLSGLTLLAVAVLWILALWRAVRGKRPPQTQPSA